MNLVNMLPYRPCAGVMLINRQGLAFAGQRLDSTGDAWQMPQGGIDKGEDPETAALRELGEETGVQPDQVTLLARARDVLAYDLPAELQGRMWGGRYRGQAQHWFLMRLEADDTAINIATKHPEFRAWRWVNPWDLPGLIVPFKRDLYLQVLQGFADHLPSRP